MQEDVYALKEAMKELAPKVLDKKGKVSARAKAMDVKRYEMLNKRITAAFAQIAAQVETDRNAAVVRAMKNKGFSIGDMAFNPTWSCWGKLHMSADGYMYLMPTDTHYSTIPILLSARAIEDLNTEGENIGW